MKSSNYSIIFLFLIFLFHLTSNLIWLNLDAFPFGADELGHLENGMTISKIIKEPLDFFKIETIFPHKWGPLHYLLSTLLILLFGYSHLTFMMTSTIFFILLLVLVYFIGKKIKDEQTGLLAVFILSIYPIVFHFSRKYSYEMAITATVVLSILCLLKIGNLENRKYSLLLGLSLGLGLLSSPRYLIFIIGPLGYIVGRYLIWDFVVNFIAKKRAFPNMQGTEIFRRRSVNVVLFLGIGFLIYLLWYFNKPTFFFKIKPYLVGDMGELVRGESDPHYYSPPILFSIENIIFHIRNLYLAQIYPFFYLLFVLALLVLLKKRLNGNLVIIFIWIGISYFILLFGKKYGRYTIQYLPAIGLISSLGIMEIRYRFLKKFLIFLIVFVGLAQYIYFSYGNFLISVKKIRQNFAFRIAQGAFDNYLLRMIEPIEGKTDWSREVVDRWPDKSNLNLKNFGKKIGSLFNKEGKVVIFLISEPWMEYLRVLEYFIKIENYPWFLNSRLQTKLFHPIHPTEVLEDFLEKVDKYDILIFLCKDKEYNWPKSKRLGEEIFLTRSVRWPKTETPEELKLNRASLKSLDREFLKFDFIEKIYVKNDPFFSQGLYINIYQNRKIIK